MTDKQIRVFIADDHPIFRKGLEEVIQMEEHFLVVGSAGDGETAFEDMLRVKPDVAVVDIEMPRLNGLDLIRRIRETALPVDCIILTMYQEEALFDQAMELGVRGYLLKDSAIADILKGIRAVSQGRYFISPTLSAHAVTPRPAAQQNVMQRLGLDRLTPTERHILSLIALSSSSRQIADGLSVSVRTIENHRYNIVRKLGLSGNYSLLRFALDNKDVIG